MSFPFIMVAFIIRYLRNSLKTAQTLLQWDKKLLLGMYISIALFIASLTVDVMPLNDEVFYTNVFNALGFIAVGSLLYFIYKEEKLKPFKFLVTAILPYLIVTILSEILKLISKSFYDIHNDLIHNISTFSVLWGIGVWLVTRKQQKDLRQAREKAIEEEQNNKVVTAMKVQLEVQVAERTAELTKQKEELELTVKELKSTQAQLIQSEKMASLGELTAGIAHEIQNPLNFVNNFSDVNNELIDEMLNEILHSNAEEAKLIANDIKDNNSKIIFHGKRADSIVKGMLQHSRKSTGQKELTDINELCDEYLRLSYHGLRAKDKSFNAEFKTSFDTGIDKINIVPQDIGRVLLNLINNAFYATGEKLKAESEKQDAVYKPLVTVETKKLNIPARVDGIEIKVSDNGSGIPQNIIDKIFQPFFTTKPTGLGTGLGLSLTYDIITKEHNGTIKVESKEGEGTTFTINLPVA